MNKPLVGAITDAHCGTIQFIATERVSHNIVNKNIDQSKFQSAKSFNEKIDNLTKEILPMNESIFNKKSFDSANCSKKKKKFRTNQTVNSSFFCLT